MGKQLYIDPTKFKRALREGGFGTIQEFVSLAGIHRNSIGQYLSHEKGVFTDLFMRVCENLNISDPLSLVSFEGERSGTLNEAILVSVLEPLTKRDPSLAFVLIGSRASGKAQKNSDWDIAVTLGAKRLGTELYLQLKSEFEDLTEDFAQSCDLVNLDAAPVWFLSEIEHDPKFLIGNRDSYQYLRGLIDGVRKVREDREGSRAA